MHNICYVPVPISKTLPLVAVPRYLYCWSDSPSCCSAPICWCCRAASSATARPVFCRRCDFGCAKTRMAWHSIRWSRRTCWPVAAAARMRYCCWTNAMEMVAFRWSTVSRPMDRHGGLLLVVAWMENNRGKKFTELTKTNEMKWEIACREMSVVLSHTPVMGIIQSTGTKRKCQTTTTTTTE